MARRKKLDPFHWHEALDRASLVAEVFSEYLLEHPVIHQTPALRKRAEELAQGLFDLYQAIGAADTKAERSKKSSMPERSAQC